MKETKTTTFNALITLGLEVGYSEYCIIKNT